MFKRSRTGPPNGRQARHGRGGLDGDLRLDYELAKGTFYATADADDETETAVTHCEPATETGWFDVPYDVRALIYVKAQVMRVADKPLIAKGLVLAFSAALLARLEATPLFMFEDDCQSALVDVLRAARRASSPFRCVDRVDAFLLLMNELLRINDIRLAAPFRNGSLLAAEYPSSFGTDGTVWMLRHPSMALAVKRICCALGPLDERRKAVLEGYVARIATFGPHFEVAFFARDPKICSRKVSRDWGGWLHLKCYHSPWSRRADGPAARLLASLSLPWMN